MRQAPAGNEARNPAEDSSCGSTARCPTKTPCSSLTPRFNTHTETYPASISSRGPKDRRNPERGSKPASDETYSGPSPETSSTTHSAGASGTSDDNGLEGFRGRSDLGGTQPFSCQEQEDSGRRDRLLGETRRDRRDPRTEWFRKEHDIESLDNRVNRCEWHRGYGWI